MIFQIIINMSFVHSLYPETGINISLGENTQSFKANE